MFGPLGWVGLRGTFSPESLEKRRLINKNPETNNKISTALLFLLKFKQELEETTQK